MKLFVLLALAISAAEARTIKAHEYESYSDIQCGEIQSFEPNFKYTYQYVAVAEHRDNSTMKGNDIKIECTATIFVPRKCIGILRLRDCHIEHGILGQDKQVTYQRLASSESFAEEMSRYDLAYSFNQGQIYEIYVHKYERINVTNIKRGILSNMQVYNPDIPVKVQSGDSFKVPNMNIYGEGYVHHRILDTELYRPSRLEIVRDTAQIRLPWERRQWNFLRMKNNESNPIVTAVKNYITVTSDRMFGGAIQNCTYDLGRGRIVKSAICEERYPLNEVQPAFAKWLVNADPVHTIVRQKISGQTPVPMSRRDPQEPDWSVIEKETIMFEEEWEETNMLYNREFDAEQTFFDLVTKPINESTPALVSKLARWLATAEQENIEAVWRRCDRRCDKTEKEIGRLFWAELLNDCIRNDWCQVPTCSTQNSTTCERALETFTLSNTDEESEEVRNLTMRSLKGIYAPSRRIVQVTQRMCSADNSAECVRTLGEVTRNFLQTCHKRCSTSVKDALKFLSRPLNSGCESSDPKQEEIMEAAVYALGRMGPNGSFAEPWIRRCATNPRAPVRVAVKAFAAIGNVTEEDLPERSLSQLLDLFQNRAAPLEVRLSCFHLLMKKNIPVTELRRILNTISNENEDKALVKHCKSDIRNQVLLRGTSFSRYHPEVADACARLALEERRYDIGLSEEVLRTQPFEKVYKTTRELQIPYIDAKTNCTVKLTSVYESELSKIPFLVKLTVDATVEGREIRIADAAVDVDGLKPLLNKVISQQQGYADLLNQLLKTPVHELHGQIKHYSSMNAIMEEGKEARTKDILESGMPITLHVLGYEIDIKSFMSMERFRKLTVGNLLKMVWSLGEGIERRDIFVGQPFLMQHAVPSSIGSPMIMTFELSYVLKNKMNFPANWAKKLFSANGKSEIVLAPEFHATGSISRTVLKQFSSDCGTEHKVRIGHRSALRCVIDRTTEGAVISCTPNLEPSSSSKDKQTMKLFYFSASRSLIGSPAFLPSEQKCSNYRVRKSHNVRVCYQPWTANGFEWDVEVDVHQDTEYRTNIEWRTEREPETQQAMKKLILETTAENRNRDGVRKVLLSSEFGVIPAKNIIRFNMSSEVLSWKAAVNVGVPHVDDRPGFIFHFNSSEFDATDFKYFKSLKISSESAKKYNIEGEWKKRVEGRDFEGYKLSGTYKEIAQADNTTRQLEMKVLDFQGRSLLTSEVKAKKFAVESEPGLESSIIVEGQILPVFKKYEFEMSTHHSEESYHKVLRVSAHYENEAENPIFFVHRITRDYKKQGNRVKTSEINCVSNRFHYRYEWVSDESGHIDVHEKINMPDSPILFRNVVPARGSSLYGYNYRYTAPEGSTVGWQYTKEKLRNKDVEHNVTIKYRLWDADLQEYYQENATAKYIKHEKCPSCHTFDFKHPKVLAVSVSKWDEQNFHEEKSIKLHYSLLEYVSLPAYVSHYLLRSMKDEYIQLGYKYVNETTEVIDRKYTLQTILLNNKFNWSITYAKSQDWNVDGNIEVPALDMSLNMTMKFLQASNDLTLNISCQDKYTNLGGKIDARMFEDSKGSKCSVKADYGSAARLSRADVIDVTFEKVSGDRYDIKGQYSATDKDKHTTKDYKYVGSSNKVGEKTEWEVKMMCSDRPQKECFRFSINKGDKWIDYESLVEKDEYDTFAVVERENRYVMSAKLVKSRLYGLKDFSVVWELGPAIEFGIYTYWFNTSLRMDYTEGLRASSNMSTPLLKYRMGGSIDFSGARYDIEYDDRSLGGSRFGSYSYLNYDIFSWEKPFLGEVVLGESARSLGCRVKIPDFDFAVEYTTDRQDVIDYRNYLNLTIKPNNLTINRMDMALFGRYIEVSNTSLLYKIREPMWPIINVTNFNATIWPTCVGSWPTVIRGYAAISMDLIDIKIADVNRTFVLNVTFNTEKPLKQHFELVMNILKSRIGLLWDLNKATDKIEMTANFNISYMQWKTKTFTPLMILNMHNELCAATSSRNFPKITMMSKFYHDLPLPLIPSDNVFSLSTVYNGEDTTLTYYMEMNNYNVTKMVTTLTGCHKRFNIISGFTTACVPERLHSTITHKIPDLVTYVHVMDARRSEGHFVITNTIDITSPLFGDEPIRTTLNTNAEFGSCHSATEGDLCIPSKIHLQNLKLVIPPEFEKLLFGMFLPKESYSGMTFERCDVLVSYKFVEGVRTMTTVATVHKANSDRAYTIKQITVFMPNGFLTNSTLISGEMKIKHHMEAFYNRETWGWTFKHIFESSWMSYKQVMVAPTLLSIPTNELKFKTPIGPIRNIIWVYGPGKFDFETELNIAGNVGYTKHEWAYLESDRSWKVKTIMTYITLSVTNTMTIRDRQINACELSMANVGTIKEMKFHLANGDYNGELKAGSVISEIKKTGEVVKVDFGYGRHPWLNQSLNIQYTRNGEVFNYVATHESQYHTCETRFSSRGYKIQGKLFDLKMKNSRIALKVDYIKQQGKYTCNVVMTTYDNVKITCVTTPMATVHSNAYLTCVKTEGEKQERFINLPVNMEDFPFMNEELIRDKVLFLSRLVDFVSKTMWYDQAKLSDYFQKIWECSQREICDDLAKRAKSAEYACLKELEKYEGRNIMYIRQPAIMEYAIYDMLLKIPGSFMLLPEWSQWKNYSIKYNVQRMLSGEKFGMVHWFFIPLLNVSTGLQIHNRDDLRLIAEYKSDWWKLMCGKMSVGTGLMERNRYMNLTSTFFGWPYLALIGLNDAEIYPEMAAIRSERWSRQPIMRYNWTQMSDGRYNLTLRYERSTRFNMRMTCDHLISFDSWRNTEVKCYEDNNRERLMWKFDVAEFARYFSDKSVTFDRVFHTSSHRYRMKFMSYVSQMAVQVTESLYDFLQISRNTRTALTTTQYVFASALHESSKYTKVQELYRIFETLCRDLLRLEPHFSERYDELISYYNRVIGNEKIITILEKLLTPVYDVIGYLLEGSITNKYEVKDGAILIKTILESIRYPRLNMRTISKVSRPASDVMLFNITSITKFIRVSIDARLHGVSIYIDSVRFGLPEMPTDFVELRIRPNPEPTLPYMLEMYFKDSEGQDYGCRGVRDSYRLPTIHMHCFETEGPELPINPPSSKLVSYWDVYVDEIPHASPRAITGLYYQAIAIIRAINACSEDPEYVDRVLQQLYHVQSAEIRQRFSRSISETCRHWVNDVTDESSYEIDVQQRNEDVQERGIVYLTRGLQWYSYDYLRHSVKQDVRSPAQYAFKLLELDFLYNMTASLSGYAVPLGHLAYIAVKFVDPVGVVNVSRCTTCPGRLGQTQILSRMSSHKLPVLNHDLTVAVTAAGVYNFTVSNKCAWIWVECEMKYLILMPQKAKFGLTRSYENGVDVVFFPVVQGPKRPIMSFIFETDKKYCCDATLKGLFSTEMSCKNFQSERRGEVAGNCLLTPNSTMKLVKDLTIETAFTPKPRPERISEIMQNTCTFSDATFKKSLSASIAENLDYLANYCGFLVKEAVKFGSNLLGLTWSDVWEVTIDLYEWWCQFFLSSREVGMRTFNGVIDSFFKFFEYFALDDNWGIKAYYDAAFYINDVFYKIPSKLRAAFSKQSLLDYFNSYSIGQVNAWSVDHCAFGMITTPDYEEILSLNNHYYRLPRRQFSKCPYILAADVLGNSYNVMYVNEQLVVSLPRLTIAIDPKMRVFKASRSEERTQVTLPFYEESISCHALKDKVYCTSPVVSVLAVGTNSNRMAVYVKVNEKNCRNTIGLVGFGAKDNVPEMTLPDGRPAGDMESFVDAYSAIGSCHIGTIHLPPVHENQYCQSLFQNEEWRKSCPQWIEPFKKSCESASPNSYKEACKYANLYTVKCNSEGRSTIVAPKCQICGDSPSVTTPINKVEVTVVMSLQRNYQQQPLQDVLTALRNTVQQDQRYYEIRFVTVGGEDQLAYPELYAQNGNYSRPASEPWTLPNMPREGHVTTLGSLHHALWYTLRNTDSTVKGVGRILLFATPEELDYSVLNVTDANTKMQKELIKAYVLIPNECSKTVSKTRNEIGVRPLSGDKSANICKRTADEVATAILYPNTRVTCTCKIRNPYTGEAKSDCRPLA